MRIGLDIGGTKTDAVAVTDADEIVGRIRRPSGHGDEAVVADVVESVRELCAASDVSAADVTSVGGVRLRRK